MMNCTKYENKNELLKKLMNWSFTQSASRIQTLLKMTEATDSQLVQINGKINEIMTSTGTGNVNQDLRTYNFTEAAKKLRIGRKSLYRLVDEEKIIPVVRFGRSRRISHEALDSFIKSQTIL